VIKQHLKARRGRAFEEENRTRDLEWHAADGKKNTYTFETAVPKSHLQPGPKRELQAIPKKNPASY
jgi:hypothetical protein